MVPSDRLTYGFAQMMNNYLSNRNKFKNCNLIKFIFITRVYPPPHTCSFLYLMLLVVIVIKKCMMKIIKSIFAACVISMLVSCGGGGGGGGGNSAPIVTSGSFSMSGQIQKGPLLLGSTVWITELDANLNSTGKTYITQTKDDLGNFVVSQNVGSTLVEILATGYYMDELTGNLSTAPITLKAVADLSVDTSPTVNILTTIQNQRLKALLLQGKNYTQAYTQSQNEVLTAFGVDSTKISALTTLFSMQINGSTDQDAVLLAASSILAKMSTTAATANGSSQAAELSNYLVRIGAEIETSGALTNAGIITARNTASAAINLAQIKTNVETYYANKGVTVVTPKFEEWVDKDNSGVMPRRLIELTGINFNNLSSVDSKQLFTSNAVTISGVGAGKYAAASVSTGSTIIKNGANLTNNYTTVADGEAMSRS